jgi:drug/metabolite transporter (DMT)-like permease
MKSTRAAHPSRARLVTAFATVYLFWGSTFLAIKYAIASVPPFLMAAVRFLIAGSALYTFARLRGAPPPRREHWLGAFVIGGLLLLGGNGSLVWAEQRIASGLAALLVATTPLWMVLFDALQNQTRPGIRILLGLAMGISGLVLLVGPSELMGSKRVDPAAVAVLLAGSLCWTMGSLYSRRAKLPSQPLSTAMQMFMGSALLLVAGLLTGEWGRVVLKAVTLKSILAVLYLIVFGSLLGYTAYIWLLGATTPARVSTYAYVNPVIAVFLGWLIAGEPVTPRTLLAAAVIVSAVALIITDQKESLRQNEVSSLVVSGAATEPRPEGR